MAKCTICKKETSNMVYEPNIDKDVPLCETCKEDMFEKCTVCKQYYFKTEVVNDKCENCR